MTDKLKEIKDEINKPTTKYRGEEYEKPQCETKDYMYSVFDWHYNINKTQLKYEKQVGETRNFTPQEATTFKYRTLPTQFKNKGMIWLLMDKVFNQDKKIKKQKSKIDELNKIIVDLKQQQQ